MKRAAIHPFAQSMITVCQSLYDIGAAPARTGNVSALHEGLLWVTPTGYGMRNLQAESLVQLWPDGRITASEGLAPTSELKMHQAIYQARPDIGAVIHVHPAKSTALAVAHQPLTEPILSEIVTTLREVPLVPFHPPGSQSLAEATANQLKTHDALLLANHGVVTVGKTLDDAFCNLELLESYAEIYMLAKPLGLQKLSPEQIQLMV